MKLLWKLSVGPGRMTISPKGSPWIAFLRFENITYIMAKHADLKAVPDSPEEWLDEFNTFSIYQVLPEIIQLWGLNIQTGAESKKTSQK